MADQCDGFRHLDTIQKHQKLNEVFATDSEGPGGANHEYRIYKCAEPNEDALMISPNEIASIQFQKGPRKESDSIHGVIDGDLLEIVRDRLKSFQNGPFASEYNAEALEHVEAALDALNRRVEDRIARNVLGTNTK